MSRVYPVLDCHYEMDVLYLVKIFDAEFSSDLYILRLPELKKVVFENWSVLAYVCNCVGNIQSFMSLKLTLNFTYSTRYV